MGTLLTPEQIKRVRRAIERLYTGKCTVEVRSRNREKDPITKKTVLSEPTVIYSDIPCSLSVVSAKASDSRMLPSADQQALLILAPEFVIPEGSRLTITYAGATDVFGHSGRPTKYETHQEITLMIWEGWHGQKRD